VLLFVAITGLEHALRPGLSPATHEISEYANGRDGVLMAVAFALWALSLACTGLLVAGLARGRPVAAGLLLAAVGIAITAAWRTQTSAGLLKPGEALHAAGRLHDVGSGLATVALLAAALLSLRLTSERLRHLTVTVLVIALPADLILLAIGSEVAGVRQRVLVAAACAWQLALLASRRVELRIGTPSAL
jgi:hypothetical protein